MPRAEADGPLALHLRAIGKDECIYDDADVFAVLQAAARIEELERCVQETLEQIRRLHRPDEPDGRLCREGCAAGWPCDSYELADYTLAAR